MPNQHATESITWHPKDPGLKPWIRAEAERRDTSASVILDEGMTEYRARREMSGKQVHHLDGDPRNVDPSNLELRERPQ